MMGSSVIFASGDYGVAGRGGDCLNNSRMYWEFLEVLSWFFWHYMQTNHMLMERFLAQRFL